MLGRTGMSVSEVSLGGAYLKGPDPERHEENAAAVVRRAAELGINYLDTAPGYAPSEELLGPAMQQAGRPFRVATKVGFVPEDFDFRRDSVVASLEASLRKLRIDRLAVAQIHEVNLVGWERIMEPGGALDGLRAARDAGLCEAIGITGRAIPLLARAGRDRRVRHRAGLPRLPSGLAEGSGRGHSGGGEAGHGDRHRHAAGRAVRPRSETRSRRWRRFSGGKRGAAERVIERLAAGAGDARPAAPFAISWPTRR